MTIGLLIGADGFHRFFYQNCPDTLIDEDIRFLPPEDILMADLWVVTPYYLKRLPTDLQKPIVLLSDDLNNQSIDHRIALVHPFPTSPEALQIFGDLLLIVKGSIERTRRLQDGLL